MKRILFLLPFMLGACTTYHAADQMHPPRESAANALIACNNSDPAYWETNSFGLAGVLAYGASGAEARTRACMAAKGFAAN